MYVASWGRVDNKVLEQAKELYGGNVLNTVVKYQERLKSTMLRELKLVIITQVKQTVGTLKRIRYLLTY